MLPAMRLTTKGRYAVTAMIDLALHQGAGAGGGVDGAGGGAAVSLRDIALSQSISLSYLEQLFARLRHGGLVAGLRGPGGGYRFARAPGRISIAEIISAVDERIDATLCGGSEDCQHGERCLTHDLWSRISDKLYDFLDDITLGDLMQWPSVQAAAARQDAACQVTVGVPQPAARNQNKTNHKRSAAQ